MALIEQTFIDKIEIVADGVVQVRRATKVLRDGDVIATSYHRQTLTPGQDVSNQPTNVQAVCAAAWTPEVLVAFNQNASSNP